MTKFFSAFYHAIDRDDSYFKCISGPEPAVYRNNTHREIASSLKKIKIQTLTVLKIKFFSCHDVLQTPVVCLYIDAKNIID